MKKILIFLIIVFSSIVIGAQRNDDLGVFAGTSYYYGDLNAARVFYSPGIALGGLFRFNVNKRCAFRVNAYFTRLSADPNDFSDRIHDVTSSSSFNKYIFDATCQVEFNFMPYIPTVKKWEYTPYVSGGIGYFSISDMPVTIPFGAGLKLNITNSICTGFEWSFRKTFNDMIDNTSNPTNINALLNNNDWYSFLGIFVTYKFFYYVSDCPAYED